MKEQDFLDDLFQKARTEPPKQSFEATSKKFIRRTSAPNLPIKLNPFSVNLIIISVMSVTIVISLFLWNAAPEVKTPAHSQIIETITSPIDSPQITESTSVVIPTNEPLQAENSAITEKKKDLPKPKNLTVEETTPLTKEKEESPTPVDTNVSQSIRMAEPVELPVRTPKVTTKETPNTFKQEELPESQHSLRITYYDTDERVNQFIADLQETGITVVEGKASRKNKMIDRLQLELTHPDGLNFKYKVKGFQILDFHFRYNENGELTKFAISLNKKPIKSDEDWITTEDRLKVSQKVINKEFGKKHSE